MSVQQHYEDIYDERRSEAVRVKNSMPSLLGHDGWRMISTAMKEECTRLQQQINQPAMSSEALYMIEGMKGELRAIQRVMMTPESMLDDAKSVIESLKEEKEADDE